MTKPKSTEPKGSVLPLSKKLGGRPNKPVIAFSTREQFKHQMQMQGTRRKVVFCLSDLALMTAIATAKHGERGAFVKQLAKQKRVRPEAIWRRISEIVQLTGRLTQSAQGGIFAVIDQHEKMARDLDRMARDAAATVGKAAQLLGDSRALLALKRLDLQTAKQVVAALESNETSVSEFADTVSELERLHTRNA